MVQTFILRGENDGCLEVCHQGGQCRAVSPPAKEGGDHQLALQVGEATPHDAQAPLYLSRLLQAICISDKSGKSALLPLRKAIFSAP